MSLKEDLQATLLLADIKNKHDFIITETKTCLYLTHTTKGHKAAIPKSHPDPIKEAFDYIIHFKNGGIFLNDSNS